MCKDFFQLWGGGGVTDRGFPRPEKHTCFVVFFSGLCDHQLVLGGVAVPQHHPFIFLSLKRRPGVFRVSKHGLFLFFAAGRGKSSELDTACVQRYLWPLVIGTPRNASRIPCFRDTGANGCSWSKSHIHSCIFFVWGGGFCFSLCFLGIVTTTTAETKHVY